MLRTFGPFTPPKQYSDVVHATVLDHYSKDPALFSGGQFKLGQIVAELDGKTVAWNPSAADDSAIIVGIALDDVDATAADVEGSIIARGAVLLLAGLVWPSNITDAQRAAAIKQLGKLTLPVRIQR